MATEAPKPDEREAPKPEEQDEDAPEPEPAVVLYQGAPPGAADHAYVNGVPARDLTATDWASLTPEQQAQAQAATQPNGEPLYAVAEAVPHTRAARGGWPVASSETPKAPVETATVPAQTPTAPTRVPAVPVTPPPAPEGR